MDIILWNYIVAVKLQDYKGAAKSFEEALELSRDMNDEVAENAIKSALNDVNKKMAHVRRHSEVV